jgi:TP901 family phage tail tape measure protein
MDRDLKIRVILTKLGDLVGPLKAIGNQSKVTTEGLRGTQAQLKALQATQNNIASFRQLKTQLRGTETEMVAAQARVDSLATAFNNADKPTKKLSAEFANAKKYAAALKTQHTEQAAALQGLRDKLGAAGVSTRDLVAGERALRGDLVKTTEQLAAQKKALGDLAQADRRRAANTRQLNQTRARAGNMAIGGAATFGTGLAILAPIQAAIGVASQYQAIMTSIAQKTGLSRLEAGKLGMALASLGPRVNQLPADLAAGADVLAGFGLTAQAIPQLMLPIGRAATAYEAQIEDLSKASFAVVDNLKVPFGQTGRAIDIMAEAGKRGAFELKDMAQYFPALTASAQGLGQTGAPAVADLAAALQITRKGAGDASTAANNLQNLLAKISSPGTTKAFAKMGVDLPKALNKMYAEGKTPIEAISELTNKTLKGDLSKLGNLFEDMQVQQALRPLIGNLALYRQIRSDALKASGTVEADYAERLLDAGQGSKALEVVTQSLQVKLGTVLIPTMVKLSLIVTNVLDRMIQWADANPRLAQVIAITAAALGVILLVAGGLAVAIAGILGPFALMRYAMLTMAPSAWGLATALWAAAAPILPFILAAAGLIAIAVAIYNHWNRLAGLFSRLGSAVMDGFVNGVVGRWNAIRNTVTGIADKVAGAFKNALGIRSPSRVFAGYGHNLMAGLANGIAGNTGAPLARISNASRAITAALAIGAAAAGPASAATAGGGAGGKAAAGASSGGNSYVFNITQQPGESADALARRIAAEFDKRDRAAAARQRSSMGDYGE